MIRDLVADPLIFLTCVMFFGILAQWTAWKFKLPSILILLGFGFLTRIVGGVRPDDLLGDILLPVVSLSVAVILFEGGMTLHLSELKESGSVVLRLVTIGVLVSWLLTWWLAATLLGMDGRVAALLGAILVVTGPTVVSPLLRHIRPTRRVAAIVKWEGIVIDPIGALLAVLVYDVVFLATESAPLTIVGIVSVTILSGLGIAAVTAVLMVQLMKRYWIPDFLHNPVLLAMALATFTLSDYLQPESGLVTVTLLGIMMANQKTVSIRHVVEFKENLRVLLISCLFIVLAARVDPESLLQLGWPGVVFVMLMIVFVRPVSILLATAGSGIPKRERLFLGMLAPRGIVAAAVSSVFAIEVSHRFEGSNVELPMGLNELPSATFLVIVGTVTVYGLCSAPIARRLGLSSADPQGILFAGAAPWIRAVAKAVQDAGFAVMMVDTNYRNISAARMDGIPVKCASILSEYITEDLDLAGVGRLLAVTANDDLNRLAAIEFAHDFGTAEVYQLVRWNSGGEASRREAGSQDVVVGRTLFRNSATFGNFASRIAAGAEVKRTTITDEFTYDDFLRLYGDNAWLLFVITESRTLLVETLSSPLDPKPGQTVIALVDPMDN